MTNSEESATSTSDTRAANNGRGSEAWSRAWTHLNIDSDTPASSAAQRLAAQLPRKL
jgi:hypothetical protein